ncbi:MAG: hypothetical protein AB1649_31895 [Chloroflexota bacterium]
MNIDVELFGQLLQGMRRRRTLTLEQPAKIREVANLLGLKTSEVGLITMNGVQSELDDFVSPDSRVCFFPHMSGG